MTDILRELATPRQLEYMDAISEHGGIRAAAKALNVNHSTISKSMASLKRLAAKRGHSPDHDMVHQVPDGYAVKGTSTLYKDGQPALQWVKTSIDRERQYEIMQQCIADLCEDIKPLKPRKTKGKGYSDDCMAVYPLGDPHIGMLSWGEETGQDWDLEIAEAAYSGVWDRLIKVAPQCRECAIVNLGDYFHYDNMEGVTSRSGHSLDVDSRYAKMVRVGVRIMRNMIERALEHHDRVRVVNAIGNHDDTGAIFMNVALANIYDKEPRVAIDDSATPVHYLQFGKCMAAIHHGHTVKMKDLPQIMACDEPKMWGDSAHRYGYTGHIHHDSAIELPGCKVESFRTLAAKDAYAAWSRYRSGQDSKCIVLHREHGEIERHTVNISMID